MDLTHAVLEHLGITLEAGTEQYRCSSPLRAGSDSKSFSIKVDAHGGTYFDHVSQEKGTLAQLAEKLGITYTRSTTSKRAYTSGADYATQHGVAWSVLEAAGWSEVKHLRRPALRIDTAHGPRYRFLDYRDEQTYINEKGFTQCWYMMHEAVRSARMSKSPLIYCNGECSAVVAQHYGLAACTIAGGGEKELSSTQLDELKQLYTGSIIVALDCDDKGRAASVKLVSQLRSAGYVVHAVNMQLGNGGDLADWCKLYQHESLKELIQLPAYTQEITYAVKPSIISAAELDRKRFEALRWIVEDILPEGCFILAGKPKSRKSWLTTHVARTVAMGGLVFGKYQVTQGNVLYMDLESNQRRMQSRLKQMEIGEEGQPANLYITNEWQRGEQGISDLDMFLTQQPCSLVVIDILENIRAPRTKNANPYTEDYDAVKPFNQLAEHHKCCILMVHHTRKSRSEDAFDEISGTTGLVGGVSGMLILSRLQQHDEHTEHSELLVRGRDIEADDKRVLKWHDEHSHHLLEGDSESYLLTAERAQIVKLLGNGNHWRAVDIADAIGKSRQNTHKLLQKMRASGHIKQDAQNRYFIVEQRTYPVGYSEPTEPVHVAQPTEPPPAQPAQYTSMYATLQPRQQEKVRESVLKGDKSLFSQLLMAYGITAAVSHTQIWNEVSNAS